jgi:hypothetical protein
MEDVGRGGSLMAGSNGRLDVETCVAVDYPALNTELRNPYDERDTVFQCSWKDK